MKEDKKRTEGEEGRKEGRKKRRKKEGRGEEEEGGRGRKNNKLDIST
jgi:hypothetical protein